MICVQKAVSVFVTIGKNYLVGSKEKISLNSFRSFFGYFASLYHPPTKVNKKWNADNDGCDE